MGGWIGGLNETLEEC
jgi:hypothetical protein